jgi:hypothetical protein
MKLRIAATAILLLAGCGSQSANQQTGNAQAGDSRQAAAEQPAGAAAGGAGSLTIQPGLWEISMAMQAAQGSGMPAGMHVPPSPPTIVRTCVTPEQVSRANAGFLSGNAHRGMTCDYSQVSVTGGRIQGTSSCSMAGMVATATMDGSFTPTSYDIHQQMRSDIHGRTVLTTSQLAGRRIGECTPGQAEAAASAGGNGQGSR